MGAKLLRGLGTWKAKLRGNAGSKTTLRLGNLKGKAERHSWGQSLRGAKLGAKLLRCWETWWSNVKGKAGGTAGSKTTSRVWSLDGKAEKQHWGQSCEQNYFDAGKLGGQS